MKKLSTLFTLLMVALLTVGYSQTVVQGNTKEATVIPTTKSGVYKLIFDPELASNVKVQIFDPKSHLLLEKRMVNTEGFMQPLDFSYLPEGAYSVQLVSGNQHKEVAVINHTTAAEKISPIHIGAIDGFKKIGFVAADHSDKKFNLYFYDDQANLLYEDEVMGEKLSKTRYDFSNVNTKSVSVSVIHQNQQVTEKSVTF